MKIKGFKNPRVRFGESEGIQAKKIESVIDEQSESNCKSEIQKKDDFNQRDNLANALEEFNDSEDYEVRISTKDVFPNVMISNISSSIDLKEKKKPRGLKKIKKKSSLCDSVNLKVSQAGNEKKTKSKMSHSNLAPSAFQKILQIDQIDLPSDTEEEQSASYSQQEEDDNESYPQSLAVVEGKLNDAIRYIESNKIFELEQFLYNFKAKYLYLTEKIQIKWRLLMAHCKEYRKEFQRAAILYNQVIESAQVTPCLLSLDIADIYHRLGICYTQIRLWNEGIVVLVKALNQYKYKQKRVRYAECMNNLGTLYLNGGQILEAEKCFLISYSVKKEQYVDNSRKLLSCLFNLFQCNLIKRNYIQADNILRMVENIILGLKDNKMLMGGVFRRKGKLNFMKGSLELAEEEYEKAIEKLKDEFAYSLEYGEALNNFALLKLDQSLFTRAKDMFQKSLSILNYYYNRDTVPIQTLKKNLELVQQHIKKERAKKREASSTVYEKNIY